MLVTRRAEQAGDLAERLASYGAEVVEVPLIRIEPPTDVKAATAAVKAFAAYDHVVFTSVNAVAAVKAFAARAGVELATAGPALFAVGPATADALAGIGLRSEPLPDEYSAAGVARLMEAQHVSGRRVLLPRSEIGRDELPAALRKLGLLVDDIAFYLTAPDPEAPARLSEVLSSVDIITFGSGSAAAAFAGAVPAGWQRLAGQTVAVIGPAAAAASRLAGLEPDVEAADHTAAGLAGAIAAYFER